MIVTGCCRRRSIVAAERAHQPSSEGPFLIAGLIHEYSMLL